MFAACKALADETGFVIVNGKLFDYLGLSQNVVVPSGVVEIDPCTFCESEIKSIAISEGITKISEGSFSNCKKLSKVQLPSSLRVIEKDAFAMCLRLTSLIIPEGVEEIGEMAFLTCSNLKTLSLPQSVTHIGNMAIGNKTTVCVPAGSYAEQYAKENKIALVSE